MFQAHVLIIRKSKLHYTASGIITPIGDCLVHRLVNYWDKYTEMSGQRNVKIKYMFYRETNAGSCEESLRKMQVLSAVIERGLSRGYCDPTATACCGSNETPTWCNTVQILFLQGHSTCFVGVSFDLYYDARKHKIKICMLWLHFAEFRELFPFSYSYFIERKP